MRSLVNDYDWAFLLILKRLIKTQQSRKCKEHERNTEISLCSLTFPALRLKGYDYLRGQEVLSLSFG